MKKMGRRPKLPFLPNIVCMDHIVHTYHQQAHEKMLHIVHYQRNANQSYKRYHLTLVQNAIIKKSTNNKCWRVWRKEKPLHCWQECKLVQSLWKTIWSLLKKLKMGLLYNPAFPLMGIYPKGENTSLNRYMHPAVHSSIVYNIQEKEAT